MYIHTVHVHKYTYVSVHFILGDGFGDIPELEQNMLKLAHN